jgi:uncharacterized protein
MRFNVAQLLKEGVGSRRSYSLDETVDTLPESGTTRVWGELVLTCTDKGIWVNGPIETNASGVCSRCLSPAQFQMRFRIDDEYLTTVEIDSGSPINVLEVTDGALTLDSQHTLDLTEAVRQYIIVHLPMKPLCRQGCAGLCSACGANLNDAPCTCSAARDSRWSPLLDLLTS